MVPDPEPDGDRDSERDTVAQAEEQADCVELPLSLSEPEMVTERVGATLCELPADAVCGVSVVRSEGEEERVAETVRHAEGVGDTLPARLSLRSAEEVPERDEEGLAL